MAGTLSNFIIRGFQFLFGVVVLGLSVTLIRAHHWGSLPATLGFAAVVGGASILGALIGLAATWFSFLDGAIGLIVDGVVALINAAGGILMAIKLRGVQCKNNQDQSNGDKILGNDMLNGGCLKNQGCYWVLKQDANQILSNCRSSQADTVFMFLTVAVLFASALLTFLRMRKGY